MSTFSKMICGVSLILLSCGTFHSHSNESARLTSTRQPEEILNSLTSDDTRVQFFKQDSSNAMFRNNEYILDTILTDISEQEFEDLKSEFSSSSTLSYNSKMRLEQFFPPMIQALNNKFYQPSILTSSPSGDKYLSNEIMSQKIPEINKNFSSKKSNFTMLNDDINCWSTVLEFNRLMGLPKDIDQPINITYVGRYTANDVFSHFFQVVPEGQESVYDTIIYGGLNTRDNNEVEVKRIDHMAIYLGHGLVFEKTNPSYLQPFRISRLKDIEGMYGLSEGKHFLRLKPGLTLPNDPMRYDDYRAHKVDTTLAQKDMSAYVFSLDSAPEGFGFTYLFGTNAQFILRPKNDSGAATIADSINAQIANFINISSKDYKLDFEIHCPGELAIAASGDIYSSTWNSHISEYTCDNSKIGFSSKIRCVHKTIPTRTIELEEFGTLNPAIVNISVDGKSLLGCFTQGTTDFLKAAK